MQSFIVLIFILFVSNSVLCSDELFLKLIQNHPQTKALKTEIQAKYHEAVHEGIFPDPKIGMAFRSYPYTGKWKFQDNEPDTPGMTGIEYGISQEIPYPLRLSKSRQLKFLEYRESQIQYEIESNTLIAEFLKTLNDFKTAENVIQILESYSKLAESIQKTSSAEYIVGKKQLGNISKAHISKVEVLESVLEWNSKKAQSLSKLKYFVNEPELRLENLLEFSYVSFLERFEKNLGKLNTLSDNPILKQSELLIKKAQIQKDLGEIEHLPDTEVFFSYMKRRRPAYMLSNGAVSTLKGNWDIMDYNEFRGDLFSIGVNVKIPVWSLGKIKDLNTALSYKKKRTELELEKVTKLLQAQIEAERVEIESLSRRIQFMEKEHMQSLNQNLNSLKANYQTGKTSFVEILMAQVEVLNLKLQIETLKARKFQTLISLLESFGIYSQSILKGEKNAF